ncbi:MAG: N-acetylneuraminate lyase [Lachnospiraceae bacterium]|nr:N-acetylneuraminate lyase [Lachnospiraceae bacterium]MCI9135571.1 N-acetylneuraminate lyase [Lachnospiraceae bacterium]
MANIHFTGIIPALVTPLKADETIHEETARRLMNWQMDQGVDGFYLCGGTGEGPVVQPGERMKLAEIAREETAARGKKLIVHVGCVDLKSAIELAEHAGKIEADGISSVPPFFFHYGEEEIRQYYTALAEAARVPVIMYASPLSGVNITWDMVERLLDVPYMAGVKWTSYDYYTMRRIKELNGGDINVLNGPDELLLCGLAMGADGGVGATYNIMPRLYCRLYEAFRAGQMEEAQKLQYKANRVIQILIRYGVVPSVKEILKRMGYDCGYCVYPAKRLELEEAQKLNKELDELRFEEEYVNL